MEQTEISLMKFVMDFIQVNYPQIQTPDAKIALIDQFYRALKTIITT